MIGPLQIQTKLSAYKYRVEQQNCDPITSIYNVKTHSFSTLLISQRPMKFEL